MGLKLVSPKPYRLGGREFVMTQDRIQKLSSRWPESEIKWEVKHVETLSGITSGHGVRLPVRSTN